MRCRKWLAVATTALALLGTPAIADPIGSVVPIEQANGSYVYIMRDTVKDLGNGYTFVAVQDDTTGATTRIQFRCTGQEAMIDHGFYAPTPGFSITHYNENWQTINRVPPRSVLAEIRQYTCSQAEALKDMEALK